MEDEEQQSTLFVTINGNTFGNTFLETMAHFVAIALVVFIIWHAVPGSILLYYFFKCKGAIIFIAKLSIGLFSWHPTFMILGFGFFMLEAILIFSKNSSLVPSAPRATKVKYHWILQVLAVICAVGGFLAIFVNKNRRDKPHFVSWHGCLGGITVFMTCFQACMGTGLLYPTLPIINKLKLAVLKKLHALSGTLIFVLSCLVIFLAFYSSWFVKNVKVYSVAWGVCAVCPIFFAATVNNQVAQAYLFKKS